jgi:diguanylate cyclase (GGDEF)-like protein
MRTADGVRVSRKAAREIRVLALAALAALVVVSLFGVARLGEIRDRLHDSRVGIAHGHELIAEVQERDAELLLRFFAWLTWPDLRAAESSEDGLALNAAAIRLTDSWDDFLATPAVSARDAELRQRFDALNDEGFEAAERLFVDGPFTVAGDDVPTLHARMLTIGERQRAAVERGAILAQLRHVYAEAERATTEAAEQRMAQSVRQLAVATAALVAGLVALFVVVGGRTRRRAAALADVERELAEEGLRNDLEARLHRAFEMVSTEAASFGLVEEAVAAGAPDATAELLVADSSRAHLRRVAATSTADDRGCGVSSPNDCPAARHGQTQVFASSLSLDACPYLKDRAAATSAVCVPVSIAGNTVGVLHATPRDVAVGLTAASAATLEMVARKAGERVGMLRAFARSETQARTDPLTGLLNRRSLEERAREVVGADRTYSVAFGDLDHFKQVNDVHGHEAGDRALRLFARVVRDACAGGEVAARYGGEEFVIVLPDAGVVDAVDVADRVRAGLGRAIEAGTVPRFTVSFGIASSDDGDSFADVVDAADAALMRAKSNGRDRVVVAGVGAELQP